jgi:uncharacterized protein (TIGR03382 family)
MQRLASSAKSDGLMQLRFMPGAALVLAASSALAAPKSLGLNVHQSTTVGLDATKDSLAAWVRIDVNWYDVEKSQGQFDWTVIDAVVDGAKAQGLSVLAVLAYTPAWASAGDNKGGGTLNDVPKPSTYAAFVTAAVNHLKNRVTHYELWNEPNLGPFFEGAPNDYIQQVLNPGSDALHVACAGCKVLGPALATVGNDYATWMDAVLAQSASKIDIVSGHVYAAFPQDVSTAGTTSDSFYNKLESHRVIQYGGVTIYEGQLSFKEVMDKHKIQKPFWLTETGKEATLGDGPAEQAQLKYVRHVLESMLVRPWWENTIFYEAFDEPPAPYHWGLVVHDPMQAKGYTPKPAFALLQKAIAQQPAFGGTGTDCSDGLDNDGDGKIDFPEDPDCKSASTTSEGPYMPPPMKPDAGAPAPDDAGPPLAGDVIDAGDDAGASPPKGGGCSTSGGGAPSWPLALLLLRRRRRG